MFNFLMKNFSTIHTPSILVKINVWFFLNTQIFKNRFNNYIIYFIEHMSNLNFKIIKVYYEKNNFELFFSYFLSYFVFFFIFAVMFIL